MQAVPDALAYLVVDGQAAVGEGIADALEHMLKGDVEIAAVVDHEHAGLERGRDEVAVDDRRGRAFDRTGIGGVDRRAAVDRVAESVEDAAEDLLAHAEREGLAAVVRDSIDRGLLFLNDADARPIETAHPRAHLWDNGENAAEELANVMEVRSIALSDFGEHNVVPGTPLAELQETFAALAEV
mgnify:CR=1 FL=1